jgi:hypothetical protein
LFENAPFKRFKNPPKTVNLQRFAFVNAHNNVRCPNLE